MKQLDICRELVRNALKKGTSETDVSLIETSGFEVQVRGSEVETIKNYTEKRVCLRIFIKGKSSEGWSADFSNDAIEGLLERLITMAKETQEDPFAGLPDDDSLIKSTDPENQSIYDSAARADIKEKISMALAAENSARSVKGINNSEGSSYSETFVTRSYVSSKGTEGEYRKSLFEIVSSPVAEGKGQKQTSYWDSASTSFAGLQDPETVGKEAAKRAVAKLGSRKIKTCNVPVVIDSQVSSSLMQNLAACLSGYSVFRSSSFLKGKIGERIGSDTVSIIDDPAIPGRVGSRPFDAEGVKAGCTAILERGILKSFLTDSYSGRKLGMVSTGNGFQKPGIPMDASPTNLILSPGENSLDNLIGSLDTGLYITDVIGFGFNPVTGDYSKGAFGIWVEKGELCFPVHEITIASNLLDMLSSIEMIGSDLPGHRAAAAPSIKISSMTIGGE